MAGVDGEFSLAKLQTELEVTNTAAYPADGNDAADADLLNEVPAPASVGGPHTVREDLIDSALVRGTIPSAELDGLTAAAIERLEFYTAAPVTANTSEVRSFFGGLGLPGATLSALDALTQRDGSRAEYLWGVGTIVTHQQISAARSL